MEASWLMTQIRGLFASIIYCVYSLIEFMMQGIFDISKLQLLSGGIIKDVYTRIYAFLTIFMIFKLTISLFSYMVNPDSIADKEKGASKLVVNTVVMLALVLMLPAIFSVIYKAQEVFLPVLPKVILGSAGSNESSVSDNAELMSTSVLGVFYSPCASCAESDKPEPITSLDDIMDTYGDKKNGIYEYDFNFFFALGAGVVMIFIVVSMTIKVGIRVFKMFMLEIIAPIPVMSYIDPKSAKNGAFAAWTKQLVSTFLDIFVRLGVIYIVLMLLTHLSNDTLFDMSTFPTNAVREGYLRVFLIIALLMFAKDAPNFLKDALGIKHDKDTSGALAATAGAILGAGTGFISGAISGQGLHGAVTGAVHGASAGLQGGMTGKKANAWSAAGDAALQARTGDSKAKSGILAAMQNAATKAQLANEGRKLNLTDETIAEAKQNMLDMQAIAATAQQNWDVGLHTGEFRDLNGNLLVDDASGTARDKAAAIVSSTSTASTIATKNYEKANKAGDAYRINRDFANDYKKDKKDSKVDYKRGKITKGQYKAKGQFNPQKGHMDRT